MGSTRTMRTLALIACALGAITLCCWLGVVFLNPYPVGAQCGTQEGYAAIEAHAETNSQLLLVAVLCAGTGVVVCLWGAISAVGRPIRIAAARMTWDISSSGLFLLGSLPFIGVGAVSLIRLIVSLLPCQN
jgi:hypothetical protein